MPSLGAGINAFLERLQQSNRRSSKSRCCSSSGDVTVKMNDLSAIPLHCCVIQPLQKNG
jgi:hypothetical protein